MAETQRRGVAVVGGGTMGVGIAYVFAAAGCAVHVVEPDPARVEALRRELDAAAAAGPSGAVSTPTSPPVSPRRSGAWRTSRSCRRDSR